MERRGLNNSLAAFIHLARRQWGCSLGQAQVNERKQNNTTSALRGALFRESHSESAQGWFKLGLSLCHPHSLGLLAVLLKSEPQERAAG